MICSNEAKNRFVSERTFEPLQQSEDSPLLTCVAVLGFLQQSENRFVDVQTSNSKNERDSKIGARALVSRELWILVSALILLGSGKPLKASVRLTALTKKRAIKVCHSDRELRESVVVWQTLLLGREMRESGEQTHSVAE